MTVRKGTRRAHMGSLCALAGLLAIVAIVATSMLNPTAEGAEGEETVDIDSTCSIGMEGSSVNSWLCSYIYAAAATVLVGAVVVITLAGEKLWYRGSCYYATAFLALAINLGLWGVAAYYVTQATLDINSAGGSPMEWRWTLMGASLCIAGAFALGLLLRLRDVPGTMTQSDLDDIEAGKDGMKLARQLPPSVFITPDGRRMDRMEVLKHVMNEERQNRAALYDKAKSYADSGFLPDTIDPRDRIFVPNHPEWYGSWLLPKRVDLSNTGLLPPTLNQGQLGSCVANAAANTIRYMVRRASNGTADFAPSRLFIYYHARASVMGKGTTEGNGNSGCFLRAACKALQKYSVCSEERWPYIQQNSVYNPSLDRGVQADAERRRPLFSKLRYTKVLQQEFDICSALEQGYPIMCGIYAPKRYFDEGAVMPFREFGGCGFLYDFASPVTAAEWEAQHRGLASGFTGHAVVMVGYDRKRRVFKFLNSWGGRRSQPPVPGTADFFEAPFQWILDPKLANDFWIFKM